MIATALVILLFVSVLFDFIITSNRYITEYNKDKKLEDISTRFSIAGVRVWLRVRKYQIYKNYRVFTQFILNRMISSHPHLIRGMIGICASAIVFHYASESKYVAAATVFYATMMFVDSQFEYAAICPVDSNVSRYEIADKMDTIVGSVTVMNRGAAVADNIQARMKVFDPIRGLSYEVRTNIESGEDCPTTIQPSHEGEYRFVMADNDNKFRNRAARRVFHNHLGDCPKVRITLSSPNTVSNTHIYSDLPKSEAEDASEIMESLASSLDSLKPSEEYKV